MPPWLSGLMDALRKIAADRTIASDRRTLVAETEITDCLVTEPAKRKQMLDELERAIAAEAEKGTEFWQTVLDFIRQLRADE